MKAKDYAKMIVECENTEEAIRNTLVEIGIMFDKETASLVKSRNVKTNEAFKSVLNEMDLKWKAFAKLSNNLINPDGYRIIMRELHPTTAEFAWPALS